MQVTDTGLPEPVIKAIQQVFMGLPAIEEALLYGSRAKGNYRPGSDIDLTLKGEHLTYANVLDIELALDDLLLPYKIDISLYQQLDNPALIEHISRVGKAFYRRDR